MLNGEQTAAAEDVFGLDAEWAVPLLWRSEFRSVLALYLRRGMLSDEAAVDLCGQAARLVEGREHEVDTARVLALVRGSNCSASDCEFVALAEAFGVRLVTSDGKILAAFSRVAMSPAAFARGA